MTLPRETASPRLPSPSGLEERPQRTPFQGFDTGGNPIEQARDPANGRGESDSAAPRGRFRRREAAKAADRQAPAEREARLRASPRSALPPGRVATPD